MYRWVLVRLQNLLGPAVDPNTVCWQTHWKRLPLGHWPSTIFLMPGLPWTQNFSSLGSVTTFLLSRITARFFLVSPQRLVPPYMLGMLRIAMPSRKMLLRSTPTPSHWGTEKKGHVSVLIVSQLKVWWVWWGLSSRTWQALSHQPVSVRSWILDKVAQV